MDKRAQAKRYLHWYFLLVAVKAGVALSDSDRAEIEGIVDLIIYAAVEEVRAELLTRIEALEKRLQP